MAETAPAEPRVKPTRPDEEAYKANLAEAEKAHTAAQEKLVCHFSSSVLLAFEIVFMGLCNCRFYPTPRATVSLYRWHQNTR